MSSAKWMISMVEETVKHFLVSLSAAMRNGKIITHKNPSNELKCKQWLWNEHRYVYRSVKIWVHTPADYQFVIKIYDYHGDLFI